MKLLSEKLTGALEKKSSGFYFCSGNDTFLVNEIADKIIAGAKKEGFTDISRLYVDSSFSWEKLYEILHSPSLFSPKIAISLQLTHWKLEENAKILLSDNRLQTSDQILVVVKGPKIERATSQTKWFQTMTEAGYWIELPIIYPSQLPEWLQHRATQIGLKLTREHAQQLALRLENNLPAAVQALEKLQLLNLPITPSLIEETIEIDSEYDVFKLIETCLAGDAVRCYSIFFNLKNSDIEPVMMIGAWARELRLLREIIHAHVSENIPLKTAAQRVGIWESRVPLIQTFMRTYQFQDCQKILAELANLDAIAKGVVPGNIWNALFVFCMKIANKEK